MYCLVRECLPGWAVRGPVFSPYYSTARGGEGGKTVRQRRKHHFQHYKMHVHEANN